VFPVNATKNAAEIPLDEGKRNTFSPNEISFVQA
jgi:hypothetical protein